MVDNLRRLVTNCIRKHVITPYHGMTRERPLALVTWGCVMQMNYVYDAEVVSFIRVSYWGCLFVCRTKLIFPFTDNSNERTRMVSLQGRPIQETTFETSSTSFRIKHERLRPLPLRSIIINKIYEIMDSSLHSERFYSHTF
jgi:hypothetical protein